MSINISSLDTLLVGVVLEGDVTHIAYIIL